MTELSTVNVPVQNTVIAVVVAVPVPVPAPVATNTSPMLLDVAPISVKTVVPTVVIVYVVPVINVKTAIPLRF